MTLAGYSALIQYYDLKVPLPDRLVEMLIAFLRQGDGKLSKRACGKEFEALSNKEIIILENKYAEIFKTEQEAGL